MSLIKTYCQFDRTRTPLAAERVNAFSGPPLGKALREICISNPGSKSITHIENPPQVSRGRRRKWSLFRQRRLHLTDLKEVSCTREREKEQLGATKLHGNQRWLPAKHHRGRHGWSSPEHRYPFVGLQFQSDIGGQRALRLRGSSGGHGRTNELAVGFGLGYSFHPAKTFLIRRIWFEIKLYMEISADYIIYFCSPIVSGPLQPGCRFVLCLRSHSAHYRALYKFNKHDPVGTRTGGKGPPKGGLLNEYVWIFNSIGFMVRLHALNGFSVCNLEFRRNCSVPA